MNKKQLIEMLLNSSLPEDATINLLECEGSVFEIENIRFDHQSKEVNLIAKGFTELAYTPEVRDF